MGCLRALVLGYHYVRIKPGRELDCVACGIYGKVRPTSAIYVKREEVMIKDHLTIMSETKAVQD